MAKDLEGQTLRVLAEGKGKLTFDELSKLEFNDLKQSEGRDVSKLTRSMINEGFLFPFYVWKRKKGADYCIDGAGRFIALKKLAGRGMEIPALPWVEVKAPDLKTAKRFVLMASSTHGKVTQESFDAFVEDIDVTAELALEFELPEMSTGEVVLELPGDIETATVGEHERRVNGDQQPEAEAEPEQLGEFGVIVVCSSESVQSSTFDDLTELGYTCKIATA